MRLKVCIVLVVALLLGWIASGQGLIIGQPVKPLSSAGYAVSEALFDGSADWLSRAPLINTSDSQSFTFSVWVRFDVDGNTASLFIFEAGGIARFLISREGTGNKLRVLAQSGVPTVFLDFISGEALTISDGWIHVYIAINTANSSQRHVYFNGVEDAGVTWTTYSVGNIDFQNGSGTVSVGGQTGGSNKMNGAMAEFWFDTSYLDDVTKFITGGCPIDLGANGETPTGSAPKIYLSRNGSGDAWAVDSSGNVNTFTVNGALSTTTAPCP